MRKKKKETLTSRMCTRLFCTVDGSIMNLHFCFDKNCYKANCGRENMYTRCVLPQHRSVRPGETYLSQPMDLVTTNACSLFCTFSTFFFFVLFCCCCFYLFHFIFFYFIFKSYIQPVTLLRNVCIWAKRQRECGMFRGGISGHGELAGVYRGPSLV